MAETKKWVVCAVTVTVAVLVMGIVVLAVLIATGLGSVAMLGLPVDIDTKYAAVSSLQDGGPLQVGALSWVVRHGGSEWSDWSMTALGNGETPESLHALKGFLADERPEVRFWAAFHLAARGDSSGVDILQAEIDRAGPLATDAADGLYRLRVEQGRAP